MFSSVYMGNGAGGGRGSYGGFASVWLQGEGNDEFQSIFNQQLLSLNITIPIPSIKL